MSTDIDQDRFEHDPEYRQGIVEEVVDVMMDEAEQKNYDVTFQDLKPSVEDTIEQISGHVQTKIEVAVEERITKRRIESGQLYSGHGPSKPNRPDRSDQIGKVVSTGGS